jgi:chromosome transmission fidelity protein 1
MNPSAEGSFFYSRSEEDSGMSLKYMLLDPTYHFKDIVEEARAVVLAGGTMSPMDDYIKHLFSYIPSTRLMTLSCGHVIPPSNLLAWPITQDSRGADFDFTFEKRNLKTMIESVGHAILQFTKNIPDGVVAFFPSYSYLDSCVAVWKRCLVSVGNQKTQSLWELLSETKPIFLEPRSDQSASDQINQKTGPAATEALLSSYSTAITASTNQSGALLLSVINGSLSEGINFSDRLGRAVIVIGLPFPNPHSAEWKSKMEYISQKAASSATSNNPNAVGKAAAREFYENATMRAVNQAVGRAIRHQNDYAAILLIDRRYGGEKIQGKLPGWIKGSLKPCAGIEEVKDGLKKFFVTKSSQYKT